MQCNDNSYCNVNSESWSCCNGKGGRAKCPQNSPNMCLDKACEGNTAHCCEQDGICESLYSGKKPCGGN